MSRRTHTVRPTIERPNQSCGHQRRQSGDLGSNHAGIHLLRDRSIACRLVRSAGVGPDDLVVEFGAGTGALTGQLAVSGARIIAIEREPRFVSRLQRRFGEQQEVRIVEADARTVMLPRRSYVVVANPPYAISTAVVRRLLRPEQTSVHAADLLVEWGSRKG